MPVTVNIHEAKTTLSKLIQRALDGEEVIIAKAGKPLVMLKPVAQPKSVEDRLALFGKYQGQIIIDENWEQSEFDEAMLERFYSADDPSPLSHVAEPPTAFGDT